MPILPKSRAESIEHPRSGSRAADVAASLGWPARVDLRRRAAEVQPPQQASTVRRSGEVRSPAIPTLRLPLLPALFLADLSFAAPSGLRMSPAAGPPLVPVAGLGPWAFSPRTRSVGTPVFATRCIKRQERVDGQDKPGRGRSAVALVVDTITPDSPVQSGGPAAASVAQLADVAGPLVQCRQDVVGGFGHQADIDPRSAEVTQPFQLVEIVGRAADRDRQ